MGVLENGRVGTGISSDESVRPGMTRRSFVARLGGALLATCGGLMRGLAGLGVDVAEAAAEMSAELGTTQAMLGAMQLGS
jgi:hypothetical protein